MIETLFSDSKKEYWFHVSNQDEMPIYGNVEKSIDTQLLYDIAHKLPKTEQEEYLKERIKEDVNLIDSLRTIVGVTDKRMYLELSYIFNKYQTSRESDKNILGESVYSLKKHSVSFFESLINRKKSVPAALAVIATYLIDRGVLSMLNILKRMTKKEIDALVENLLLPKEVQQEETKRRGHGAEQSLAQLLNQLKISFIPEDRYLNPMSSPDPNVDKINFEQAERDEETTWSMDLIIKDGDAIKVLVQGLIHSSDPGQYGVNKSGETVLVKKGIDSYNEQHKDKKELWGLVDGVGFIENPENTIFKMLDHFDTFIQLKSLYKAGLRLHKLGMVRIKAIRFDMDFYTKEEAESMFNRYGSDDIQVIIDEKRIEGEEIQAGKAWLYV